MMNMSRATSDTNVTFDNLTWSWFNESVFGNFTNFLCEEVEDSADRVLVPDMFNHTQNETGSNSQSKSCFIVCDDVREIVIIVNMAILCQTISVFAIVANSINVAVFVKMGFNDAINVTLTGLAVADMGIAIFAVWLCICYNPLFQNADLPFKPLEVVYLTAGLPRLSLARISSWILAFASFERCLCITMPLTFRTIITPRRSLSFIIGAFIIMTVSVAPTYYTSRLVEKVDPSNNDTYAGLGFTEDRFKIDSITFGIGVFLSVASFFSVSICTVVLIWSLKQTTKWRETTVATTSTGHTANAMPAVTYRNKKVGKMVSLISAIFIICFIPNTVNQLVMSLVPAYAKSGLYTNTNQVFWSVGFVLESVNASVNIFMYLKMSTRFRKTLQKMLFGPKLADPEYKSSSGVPNVSDRY